ncbi:MAG: hypothetical protein CVU47_06810 [Chloroflexi bacterium HGW-Chloroflexi-9]|nr:MAG: hypothetical protein CVU47_06810 [Chloroflexi bacterium HGW-Chloroflexi-9]
MILRWLRRDPDVYPDTPGTNALHPVSAELSEIVDTLLAQAVRLESMITAGDGSEESHARRDTVVAVLEQTRARVADAQLVLSEGQARHRAR